MNDNRTFHTDVPLRPSRGRPEVPYLLGVPGVGVLAVLCILGLALGCHTDSVAMPSRPLQPLQLDKSDALAERQPEAPEPARPELGQDVELIGIDSSVASAYPYQPSIRAAEQDSPFGSAVVSSAGPVSRVAYVSDTNIPTDAVLVSDANSPSIGDRSFATEPTNATNQPADLAPTAPVYPTTRGIPAPVMLPERRPLAGGGGFPALMPCSTEPRLPSRPDATRVEPVGYGRPNEYREPINTAYVQRNPPVTNPVAQEQRGAGPDKALGKGHYPIADVTVDIAIKDREGGLPEEVDQKAEWASQEGQMDYSFSRREWMGHLYQWEASSLCHRPLYFEEINAERYGYASSCWLQPVVSGAKFFATIPILPYKMTVEPTCEGVYALGHYRPGSCVPNRRNRIPLRPKAGLVEAGVATGLILAIP